MADDLLTPRHLKWIFSLVLIAGVLFYFMWGFAFHAFFDYANYTISVILVFTGLFGTFLYRELEKEQAKAQASE
jgi:hypothetical protein